MSEKADMEKIEAFKEYIMVNACEFEFKYSSDDEKTKESVILHCGRMLDSLELPKVFRRVEETHPVREYLRNENVKSVAASFMGIAEDDNETLKKWNLVLDDGGKIVFKGLPEIAEKGIDKSYKKHKYYCILRADGDNMSKILGNLKDDGECREFSKTCLEYCSEVANRVNSYGGITIFAGGDDLLAIVPCEGEVLEKKSKEETDDQLSAYDCKNVAPSTTKGTVFGLMKDVNDTFKEKFGKYIVEIEEENRNQSDSKKIKDVPSLSFGALICYIKYPLYEAIKMSADLLFGVAKNANGNVKNCIAVQLLKHSGQSEELLINMKGDGEKNSFLLSASQKILYFEKLINSVSDEAMIENVDVIIKNVNVTINNFDVMINDDGAAIKNSDVMIGNVDSAIENGYSTIKNVGVMIKNDDAMIAKTKSKIENVEKMINNVFKNTFDGVKQIAISEKFLHEELPNFYYKNYLKGGIRVLENHKTMNSNAKALGQTLRLMKFFVEKDKETTAGGNQDGGI